MLLWYLWANHLVDPAKGSRASADNRAIWLAVLGLSGPGEAGDAASISGRFLLVRAFTPLGLVLAVWGLCLRQKVGPEPIDLWWVWGLARPC